LSVVAGVEELGPLDDDRINVSQSSAQEASPKESVGELHGVEISPLERIETDVDIKESSTE
jgi:hypothetical protein